MKASNRAKAVGIGRGVVRRLYSIAERSKLLRNPCCEGACRGAATRQLAGTVEDRH